MPGETITATREQLLEAVRDVDEWLDSDVGLNYANQPLAHHWARITKVSEEAGEVWKALSAWTGENPRKGVCGTWEELVEELADTACAAIFAIQHLTKDVDRTWMYVLIAADKAHQRAIKAAER